MKLLNKTIPMCFIFLLLAFPSIHAQAPEEEKPFTSKLGIEILGLHLGCSYAEVQEVINKSEIQMELVQKENYDDILIHLYRGNHSLNGAQFTNFAFWKDKLEVISVSFRKDAKEMYDALRMMIEQKYGSIRYYDQKEHDDGKECVLIKDGMRLRLSYVFTESDEMTTLWANHIGIETAIELEKLEEKAKHLGDL